MLLDAGSALGRGCGPLLISKRPIDRDEVARGGLRIAIPGKFTTANFLLGLAFPAATDCTELLFSDIEAALRQRERAGLSDASTGARDDRHFVRACHFPRAPLVRSLVRYPSVRKWAKGARGRAPRQREDT